MTRSHATANVDEKRFSVFGVTDGDVVWRYLTLTKFLDLLKTSALFFSCTSRFSDDWEGTLPDESARWLDEWFQKAKRAAKSSDPNFEVLKLASTYTEYFKKVVVRRTFATCWHRKDGESSLMWDAYGGSRDLSVAVRTTIGRLRLSIQDQAFVELKPEISVQVFFANVAYADPRTTDIDTVLDNPEIVPFLVKRPEFCDEREFRMLIFESELVSPFIPELAAANLLDCPKGVHLKVGDLSSLIDSVVVAPNATDAFFEMVQREVKSHTINGSRQIPVERSSLTPVRR